MNDKLATKCSDLSQWARKYDASGALYLRVCETAKLAVKYALEAEAEKETLNAAISGKTICPRGCVIDEDKAGMVASKIRRKLDEIYHPELYRGEKGGRAVKEGWHPPDGTPLMDFIWNAALDAAAEALLISDEDHSCDCDECAFIKRILELKKDQR